MKVSAAKVITKDVSIALDLIRGVSAQFVLIGHLLVFLKLYPNQAVEKPFYIQNFGVLIFFVLSGFLISFSLFNKIDIPGYSYKEYLIERFGRIYSGFIPALFLILALDAVYIINFGDRYAYFSAFNPLTFIGNIFMVQDFPLQNTVTSFGSGRILWTLAVEWWMYLFFGFMVLFTRIKLKIYFKVLILIFLSIVPIYNLIGGRGNGLTLVWFSGSAILLLLKYDVINIHFRKSFFFL